MKLKESFVTHKNKDDYMMIDATGEFSGLVHSNATTAFIVGCLKNDTTREEIIAKMLDKKIIIIKIAVRVLNCYFQR